MAISKTSPESRSSEILTLKDLRYWEIVGKVGLVFALALGALAFSGYSFNFLPQIAIKSMAVASLSSATIIGIVKMFNRKRSHFCLTDLVNLGTRRDTLELQVESEPENKISFKVTVKADNKYEYTINDKPETDFGPRGSWSFIPSKLEIEIDLFLLRLIKKDSLPTLTLKTSDTKLATIFPPSTKSKAIKYYRTQLIHAIRTENANWECVTRSLRV